MTDVTCAPVVLRQAKVDAPTSLVSDILYFCHNYCYFLFLNQGSTLKKTFVFVLVS
jgi:hypothetical protein